MKLIISVAAASLLLTGCLKTRNDVRDNQQRQVMQQQVVTLQKTNADAAGRVAEIEEQIRELNGRVDVVENKLGQSHSGVESALKASQQQNVDLNTKVSIMQEALATMEKQIYALNTEVNALRAERVANAQAAEKAAKQAKKDPYEAAQDHFNKKDWKQSILNFQKYRDENPKGPKFADATYKIGVSFQELGMKDEAKTFYDEVVSKFPKSEEARRAKIRLKGLKK
nr:hypothetical protein CKG001_05430 [Bdellovibrio sp. CKG001]BFD61865.1 hypothetical protein BdHM001_05460 [Bdellovibrio sp. HM001]BFD65703.1 hypothetical protein HAGR004_07250 [Bdellovibrio sp. HAGR004]